MCYCWAFQMIREKKLERRRQRRKAAERQQQLEQEVEMMSTSAANHQQYGQEPEMMSTSPANVVDQQGEQFDNNSTVARQHAEADRTRRRHRRRRPKPPADDSHTAASKYENSWAAARSESEHLPARGQSSSVLVASSQSEPNALLLTPHPAVYNNDMSSPLAASRELTVQPAFLQKPTNNDLDVESRTYYSPHPSKVFVISFAKMVILMKYSGTAARSYVNCDVMALFKIILYHHNSEN